MVRTFSALVVVVVVCLGWPSESDACTCAWAGPFLTVAPTADLVVRVSVVRHVERRRGVDLAMDVEVQEVLRGAAGARGRLRIWGDNGAQCRPYVSSFQPGTEWLFAVTRVRGGEGSPGDVTLSVCGEYWARVTDGSVVGRLMSPRPPGLDDDAREELPLAEVRQRVRAMAPR